MKRRVLQKGSLATLLTATLLCGGCVVEPEGPPPPVYGYYGYGPNYPWAVNSNIYVGGRGGYWGGGHYGGGGWHGGGRR